jgi:hypothetical protein
MKFSTIPLTRSTLYSRKDPFLLSGNNSVVECDLAKVEVAGSNPVSRSIFFLPLTQFINSCLDFHLPSLSIRMLKTPYKFDGLEGLKLMD